MDDAVGHHAEERAAIVVTLPRALDELLDVPGRFVRRELETEGAEFGIDDGLQVARR